MSESQRGRRLRWWAGGLGALVGLLGVVSMVAWYAHGLAIVQPIPGGATQKINTALCFVLIGAALLALVRGRRAPALALATLVGAIGALTVLEHVSGHSFGIDSLLAPRGFAPDVTRMSVNSASTFAVIGLLLALASRGPSTRIASMLGVGGCLVASVGMLAVMGYAVDLPRAYSWHGLSQMAVTTAIEFVGVGLAMALVALADPGQDEAGAPSWPAVGSAIAIALLMFGLWHALRMRQVVSESHVNDLVVREVAQQCQAAIDDHVRAMRRQAGRWRRRVPTRDEWEADARMYLSDSRLPPSLHMVDTTGTVRWRLSMRGEPDVNYAAIAREAMAQPGFATACRELRPLFVGPRRFGPGAAGFFVIVPLGHGDVRDGLHVGAFDMVKFVDQLPEALLRDFAVSMREGDSVWVRRGGDVRTNLPSSEASVAVGGMNWEFRFTPRRGADMALSWVFAFMGAVIASLLVFFVHTTHQERRRSRQFERMVESSPIGMVLTDPQGRMVLANAAACRLFGYAVHELLGQTVEMLVPATRRAHHVEARQQFLATGRRKGERASLEVDALRRDGALVPVEVGFSTVRLDRGLFVLAIVTDVSARRDAQRHLRERTEELARSNHDLEQFAYAASHDLRAPLRAVDHLSQWLIEDLAPHMNEEQRQHGTLLRQRLQRMERLLTDLLDYSRVTRIHQDAETVGVEALVRDAAALFEWPAGFTFRIDGELPVLVTNRSALHRTFVNLIGNSIKHHDRQDGTVAVSAVDAGEFVEFRAADDGPGIDPRFHARVFEMFQTLRPRDQVEGSGMGLALVKRLVEAHGGTITLQSGGGRGTTFRFTWPKHWDGGTSA